MYKNFAKRRNVAQRGAAERRSLLNRQGSKDRRGVVAVEFAVVAPMLLAIILGMIEVNRLYETQNLLSTAAREGARFASMDREGLVPDGMTANQKMIADVETFLEANGLPEDSVTVTVKDHDSPSQDFDISDPANDLKLFDVNISVDYSAVSFTPVASGSDYSLAASVTFRNGRATISD